MRDEFRERVVAGFERRFWSKVRKQEGGCWEWTGHRLPKGYGVVRTFIEKALIVKAHRLAYEMEVGPIPPGMLCLHACDNPPCVNPAHLRIGSNSENMADAVEKRRFPSGEKKWNASLTERQAMAIKRLLRTTKRSDLDIGREFGVAHSTIWQIRKGNTWKHIP